MKNVTDSFVFLGHWPSAGVSGLIPIFQQIISVCLVYSFLERECVRVVYFKIGWIQPTVTLPLFLYKKLGESAFQMTSEINNKEIICKNSFVGKYTFDSLSTNNVGGHGNLNCLKSRHMQGILSTTMLILKYTEYRGNIKRNIVTNFSIYNTHVDKIVGISYLLLEKCFGFFFIKINAKAESMTYVNKKHFWIIKKKQLCQLLLFFLGGQKSLRISSLDYDGFHFLSYEQRRRIVHYIKKDMEICHKNSNAEPNELKDSSLVREGVMNVLKMERSTFIKFIRSKTEDLEYYKFRRTTRKGHTVGKSQGSLKESRNRRGSVSSEWIFNRTRKNEFDFNLNFRTIRKLKRNHSVTTKSDSSPTTGFSTSLTRSSRDSEFFEQVTFTNHQC
uniref:ATP synthase CF0 B subunit n=1 Tax=Chenopodium album TaxID=3559 RepID=A0A291S7X2_CHEAL|nr:ATP synthase CF0 B subunit [Chenopodium album]